KTAQTSTASTTGLTTLPATSGGTTTVITFVTPSPTGGLITQTSTASTTGLTTLPATSGGTTTVVTFITPPGGLTTQTSTASTTGLTTLPATSGGTTTVVTFVTPSACPTPSCTPGLTWAYYKLQRGSTWSPGFIPENGDSTVNGPYKNGNPELSIQGQTPARSGITTQLGFSTQSLNPSIYGVNLGQTDFQFSVVNHFGYFYPRITGNYTLSLSQVDDAVAVWVGESAVSGYTSSNAILTASSLYTATGPNGGSSSLVGSFTANSCQIIPFRLLYTNAQSSGNFVFTMVDPLGQVVVSSTQSVSNNQLVNNCWFTSSLLFPANSEATVMPCLSDQELRALHDRIQQLEAELKEAQNDVAIVESNLKTARKSDPNAGNPGVANDALKEGESRLTMIETDRGRFVKWTTGPVLFPAAEFAEKMGTDAESLWAANGPGSSEASNTDENSNKQDGWELV
ncbi:cell surface glycoprotein, partial [Fusarium mexicanum]